jgi:hypothetical protein
MTDLNLSQIKTKLSGERTRLNELIATLSRAELLEPHESGWAIKDLLAHLAVAENLNVKFARAMVVIDNPAQLKIMRGDFPDYPHEKFTLDEFNAYMTEKLRAHELEFVLAELARVRGETLAWLDTLGEEQLERRGLHAVWGEQSVRGMLRIVALHDKMHRDDVAKRKIPREV